MKRDDLTYTVEDLDKKTQYYRENAQGIVQADRKDPRVPKSIFYFNPVTWEVDPGVWHTIFGRMPDEGIWTIGTSPLESMQEFDKELQIRLHKDGKTINDIDETLRQEIHKEVFEKVDKLMEMDKH